MWGIGIFQHLGLRVLITFVVLTKAWQTQQAHRARVGAVP